MKQTFGPFIVQRGARTLKVAVTLDPAQFAENLAMRALNNIGRRTQLAFGAGEVQVIEVVERTMPCGTGQRPLPEAVSPGDFDPVAIHKTMLRRI